MCLLNVCVNGVANGVVQAVDGVFHVVRAFESDEIIHTEGDVDPVRDLETISNELRFKDIERCGKSVEELRRVCTRQGGDKDKTKKAELDVLESVMEHLESGKWIACDRTWNFREVDILNEYQFLTAKPVVYLVNLSKADFIRQKNKWLPKIAKWITDNLPGVMIPFSAELEETLCAFETDEERSKYVESIGGKASSQLSKIINTGYGALNLIHYFTGGEDEVKCWTIRAGTKAPQAAGIIHTDMERGFICAEVTKYDDLVERGNDSAVKAAGKLQTKG